MPPKKKSTPVKKGWDFLGDDSYASRVSETLMEMKAKNPGSSVNELSNFRHTILPIPEFGLQAAFNMRGLPYGTVMDILAADGIGKTSFLFTLIGWFMSQGSPCFYVETENKLMAADRIMRCLDSDKAMASRKYKHLAYDQCFDIVSAVTSIENFAIKSRDKNSPMYVPQHVPLVIALDTFSKLLSKDEAEDVVVYDADKVGETKEVGGGSNFGSAKAAHAWFRRLPFFQKKYNVVMLFARHQNDKVDMMAGKFGGGSLSGGDAYNRTSRGGRAFNQNAALQIILTRIAGISAKVDGLDEKVGVRGLITVCKNSFGPEGRKFYYQINTVHRTDTESYQEPSLTFAPYTAEWLFLKKILPMSQKNKNCYTCKDLQLFDVTAEAISKGLHGRPELLEELGSRLQLMGYDAPTAPPTAPVIEQGIPVIEDSAEQSKDENAENPKDS